jgi:hypothetical protein
MDASTALIMFAAIAAFGLVTATPVVPIISQAHAAPPGNTVCFFTHNGKLVCHPQGPPNQ